MAIDNPGDRPNERQPGRRRIAGGSTSEIMRHEHRDREFELAIGDEQTINAVTAHVEANLGAIDSVFHEIISDLIHLDVHHVLPSEKLPCHVLVTSGMSDRPMTVPDGYPGPKHLELCAFLPPDWRMSGDAEKSAGEDAAERLYWPVRWLKNMARLPHEFETFLGYGHTVPNGDPPEPFADNVEFCCMMVTMPYAAPFEFAKTQVGDREVHFLAVVPLFKEEMTLKLRKGPEAIDKAIERIDFWDMFNGARRNFGKRRFGFF